MPDNILRVAAELDVSQLLAASKTAEAAVSSSAERMAESFKAADLSFQEATAGMKSLGFAAAESSAALTAVGYAEEPLKKVATAAGAAGSGMQGFFAKSAEARAEVSALSGNVTGAEMNLARLAATSSTLGPILQAAFAPLALLAFFEIIEQIAGAFERAANQVEGYTKALQEAEKQDVEFSDKALGHAATLAGAQQNLASIIAEQGRVASEGFGQKLTDAFEKSTHAAVTQEGILPSLRDALIMTAKDPLAPFEALSGAISALWHAEGDATDYAVKLAKAQREAADEAAKLTIDTERQAVSLIGAREAADKAGLTGTSGRVEAIQIEIGALKEKAALEEKIAAQEVLAKGGAGAGEGAAAERARVAQEYEYKEIGLQKELTTAKREQQNEQDLATERSMDFQQRLAESAERLAYRTKDINDTIARETAVMFEQSADRVAKASAEEAVKVAEAGEKMAAAIFKGEDEATFRVLAGEKQQAEATTGLQRTTIEGTHDFATTKTRELHDAEVQELLDLENIEAQKLNVVVASLQRQQEALGPKAAELAAGTTAPVTSEDLDLMQKYIDLQNQIKAAEGDFANFTVATNDKIKQSNQQLTNDLAKNWQTYVDEFDTAFNSGLNRAILGQETFAQAMKQSIAQLANQYLTSIEKYLETMIQKEAEAGIKVVAGWVQTEAQKSAATAAGSLERYIVESAHIAGIIAQKIGEGIIWAVTEAEKTAVTIAETIAREVVQIAVHLATMARYAAEAAAAVFAAVAQIPVVGWILAPIAAAAAFVAVMAFGEQGGIMAEDGPLYAHKNEMVLPARISEPLQGAIPAIQTFNLAVAGGFPSLPAQGPGAGAGARTGATYGDTHIHINGGSNMSHEEIVRAVRMGVRKGQLGAAHF